MIRIDGLNKSYRMGDGVVDAVVDLSLAVQTGSWVTLLGPSGCGKSTTLRMVAGLETPTSGRISFGDRVVYSQPDGIEIPVHRRKLGMVFQSYALWPHMNVFNNVAFPLRVRKDRPSKSQIRQRSIDALDLVGLADLTNRRIDSLSGGQQQRVALARALVNEPQVLLLDEPLSNLDASLRQQMCAELRSLQQRTGVTTLFVTHDQGEALAMSDHIVLMRAGRIVQSGTPDEVFDNPVTDFAAGFMGFANVLPGRVVAMGEDRTVRVETPCGPLSGWTAHELTAGQEVRVHIRPQAITAVPSTTVDAWGGRVVDRIYQGTYSDYRIEFGRAVTLSVRLLTRDCTDLGPQANATFVVDPAGAVVLPSAHDAGEAAHRQFAPATA